MQVITPAELKSRKYHFIRGLKDSVFVYPTDTIYGIGCDARNGVLVDKVRDLKGRHDMPFSVIAPSKNWIRQHCIVDEKAEEWLAKLPGPYTLIMKMKYPEELPHSVTKGRDTLGVRIPNHWISDTVAHLGAPVITTSANKTGENHMRVIEDLPSDWKGHVKFVIYEGQHEGTPSTLIHLYEDEVKVQER